jgi:hypothetical protein
MFFVCTNSTQMEILIFNKTYNRMKQNIRGLKIEVEEKNPQWGKSLFGL